jgi:hypothetical protein
MPRMPAERRRGLGRDGREPSSRLRALQDRTLSYDRCGLEPSSVRPFIPAPERPITGRHEIHRVAGPSRDGDRRRRETALTPTRYPVPEVAQAQAQGGTSSPSPTVTPEERAILVELFEATDGPHWKTHEGWGTETNACEWAGVSCNTVEVAGERRGTVVVTSPVSAWTISNNSSSPRSTWRHGASGSRRSIVRAAARGTAIAWRPASPPREHRGHLAWVATARLAA